MDDEQRRIARARLQRRAGRTYDEIRAVVGPVSDDRLRAWLRGIPRPAATRRGRSNLDLRRRCRRMRAAGLTYSEIAARTGASKGSISPWVRDVPVPWHSRDQRAAAAAAARERGAVVRRRLAAGRRRAAEQQGRAAVGEVTDRDLFIAGLALYWAEGTKDKPWRRNARVVLVNSDPAVVAVWLAWLDLVGVPDSARRYRLSIHEDADAVAAQRWWSEALRVPPELFARPSLKRHRPRTNRRNTGDDYRGCLVVSVLGSLALYDAVDGAWHAVAREFLGDARVMRHSDRLPLWGNWQPAGL